MKFKNPIVTLCIIEESDEIGHKLAHLLAEDVIFCNNGWWFEEEGKPWPKDYITLHVNCNDVFAWGAADAEDVTSSELSDLYEMWEKDNNWGPAAWCIKKRKEMPQPPVEKLIREQAIWNLEELLK
jgi:hypothetical protein